MAIKDDKTAFRLQHMYIKAVAPLVPLLENTDDDNFIIKEAIPMVHAVSHLAREKCNPASVIHEEESYYATL